MFRSVLVANRGEIACRVIRTLRDLGIRSIGVYSDADVGSKHVREADHAVRIGEGPPTASYLNVEALIRAADEAKADAVHPGYGFLAENAAFARAIVATGLAWVGPSAEVLELTGDKLAARRAFEESGFPVLPAGGPFRAPEEAVDAAEEIGFPLMVKAVLGGGGIGMGLALDGRQLRAAVETASARGERFFADPSVYLERYVPGARHVEVQVLFDHVGSGIHLYERECSVQRRHQKVIEEAPSPAVDEVLLAEMTEAALRSMKSVGYVGAGTVECLLGPDGGFWFLEVNARIQVEHTITEATCAVDLVAEQLRVAAGEETSLDATPERRGHALECRIYAEDPVTFLPSPGRIERLRLPGGARCDFGYDEGDEVPMLYDPLIGKVVVRGEDRVDSTKKMRAALEEMQIAGVKTNVDMHLRVLGDERFSSGAYDTALLGP
jgi:acetyl-CoA carboxylase biotin carboxylase subunit